MFGDESVVDPFGCVALFTGTAGIVGQPLFDDVGQSCQDGSTGLTGRGWWLRREVVLVEVFRDGFTIDAQIGGDLASGSSFGVEAPDIFDGSHGCGHGLSGSLLTPRFDPAATGSGCSFGNLIDESGHAHDFVFSGSGAQKQRRAVMAGIQPLYWLDSGAEPAYLKLITHSPFVH